MKTFLWTTLFWIVAAIAWLLCLWFGNLWTQVLENGWLASIMPSNIQTKVCDPVVASALDWIDRCTAAEEKNCNSVEEEIEETEALTWETAWIQEPLNNIIANQEAIYKYLQESVASLNKSIDELQGTATLQGAHEQVIDEKQQQRLQLQAQIEALQNEMANL